MDWDPFQREVLEALGHVLLVPAGHAGTTPAPDAPAAAAAPGTAAPAASPAAPAAAVAGDALRRALARAAGIAEDALPGDLPSADLRGNAAAKRALWPRLRALRRTPR